MSQYAYWLVASPAPSGGASSGDLNPGVPAVVESPSATMVTAMVSDTCQTPFAKLGVKCGQNQSRLDRSDIGRLD